jgi:D-alanine--poly(phosphoribitol) ligase subunit 1
MTDYHLKDIGRSLLDAAESFADRPALSASGERLTYRALFEQAAGIAVVLGRAGILSGDRVAVLGERTATPYAAILGAVLAGCCYVPLNPKFPAERNRTILQRSGARALVIDDAMGREQGAALEPFDDLLVITPESEERAFDGAPRWIKRGDLPVVALEDFELRRPPAASSPVYLLFTSGTTGAPKGVPISHANLASYLGAIHPLIPIGPDDRVLQAVDLTFDLSVHDMMLAWTNGAELHVAPDNGAIIAPRIIAANGVTACLLVPSAGARAIDYGLATPGKMPSLRYSLFAGEALPLSVAQNWQGAAPNAAIFNLYGPTEGTIHTSWSRFDADRPPSSRIVPIGRALGQQCMGLFNADGSAVGAGEAGEIWLSGPQMTAGYWQAPHLDAERFVERDGIRWYRTGDLGREDPDQGMLFAGRLDRQMKIRGYRVELQEIEGAIRDASGGNQVAVIGWPVVEDGAADGVVAFIAGAVVDERAVMAALRSILPAYMVPDRILTVDALPLNANGKTDYRALTQSVDGNAPRRASARTEP